MAMQKPSPVVGTPVRDLVECDDFWTLFPCVLEHLTCTQWTDGSPRITSTMTLFHEEGLWKACLNDRASDRTGWIASDTVQGLVEQLEQALAGDRLDWRRRVGGKGGARKSS